jgi:hypothetical protein
MEFPATSGTVVAALAASTVVGVAVGVAVMCCVGVGAMPLFPEQAASPHIIVPQTNQAVRVSNSVERERDTAKPSIFQAPVLLRV